MTEVLKKEILTELTEDFFPCTIKDVENYAMSNMRNVSDDFFMWAFQKSAQAEEDGYLDFIYHNVYDLFENKTPVKCSPCNETNFLNARTGKTI